MNAVTAPPQRPVLTNHKAEAHQHGARSAGARPLKHSRVVVIVPQYTKRVLDMRVSFVSVRIIASLLFCTLPLSTVQSAWAHARTVGEVRLVGCIP